MAKLLSDDEVFGPQSGGLLSDEDVFGAGAGKQKKQNTGPISDLGTDIKRGVQQLPGAITGLVDIPVALATGSPLVTGLADKLGGMTGFQPGQWAKSAEAEYSPQRQAGRAEIDTAWRDGTAKDIAGAYLANPMSVAGVVAESLPSMLLGGLAGRAALGVGAKAASAAAPAVPGLVARTVGQSMAPAVGAGIGEGSVMAGQAMQNSLDAGVDPRIAAGYAGATGLAGGAIGALGGKVAQKFGVIDPETWIAGGATAAGKPLGLGRRVLGGALSEGVFEELPQSVIEQGLQNLAQGNPFAEGMAKAGVEGALAGSLMGGAANILPSRRRNEQQPQPGAATPEDTAQMNALNTELGNALPEFETGVPSVITVPNNAGGETAIDANSGPISGAAVTAVNSGATALLQAGTIEAGMPFSTREAAQKAIDARPDADRLQIIPHPRVNGAFATVEKDRLKLQAIDQANLRRQQLEQEEGNDAGRTNVGGQGQGAVAGGSAGTVRPVSGVGGGNTGASGYAGASTTASGQAMAVDAARTGDAALDELAPPQVQPVSSMPGSQAIAKQRTQQATQQADIRAQQLAQDEQGTPPVAAPRPMKVGGVKMANYTDEQLQGIVSNDNVPATSRRAAAAELAWRQSEAEAAAQAEIAQSTGKASLPRDSGWLNDLFEQATTPEAAAVDAENATKSDQAKTDRADAAIAMLTGEIKANTTEAAEIAARQYKQNRKQVELEGDGPPRNASMSITQINENRKRRMVELKTKSSAAIAKAIDGIAEDADGFFGQVSGMVNRVTQQFNEGFFGKDTNLDGHLDRAVGSMIGAGQMSGEKSAGRKLRMAAAAYQAGEQAIGKASPRRADESQTDYEYRMAAEKNQAKAALPQVSTAPESEDIAVVRAMTNNPDGALSIVTEDSMPDVDKAKPREVSKQTATFMRHVARMFGKEVVFVEGMKEDGFRKAGNKIYLSTRSSVSHVRVLGHEMLHALKGQNKASYEKLVESVGEIATDDQLKSQFKDYFALDEKMNHMSDDQVADWLKDKANRGMILEEMLADLSGNRWAESSFWESVFTKIDAKYGSEQAKGIIAKLRLALVNALNKLMSLVKGGQFSVDARVTDHLESIREALATGFADYAKAVKDKEAVDTGDVGVRFSRRQAAPKLTKKELKAIADREATRIFEGKTVEQSNPLDGEQWQEVRRIALQKLKPMQRAAALKAERDYIELEKEADILSEKYKERAATVLAKVKENGSSSVSIMDGSLPATVEGTGKLVRGKPKVLTIDIGRFFLGRQKKIDISTEEGRKAAGIAMAREAAYALTQDGHAVGWYDRKVREALAISALVHPELLTSKKAQVVFKMIAAITSNGQAVRDNFILANIAYSNFKNGVPLESVLGEGGGARRGAMVKSLIKLRDMIDRYGAEKVGEHLIKPITVKEIQNQFGLKVSGEHMTTVLPAAVGLGGPKIGSFYANLSGHFDSLTMDMWFMRTTGRITGNIVVMPKTVGVNLNELASILPESGEWNGVDVKTMRAEIDAYNELDEDEQADVETVLETVSETILYARSQLQKFSAPDADGKTFTQKTLQNENARRLVSALDSTNDSPGNGAERNNLRAVAAVARGILSRYGIDLNVADLQAVLWYYEKNLFTKLGANNASAKPWDYASAARFGVGRTLGLVDVKSSRRAGQVGSGESGRADQLVGDGQGNGKTGQGKQSKARINFEVAPNPDDVALTEAWNALPESKRHQLSVSIATDIANQAMRLFGVTGTIKEQQGGFEEETNTSFQLILDQPEKTGELQNFIGYVLSQKSMVAVSEEAFPGSEKTGVVTVSIGDADPQAIYRQLRGIRVDGNQPVSGHSTAAGQMAILNYSDVSTEELARLIDSELRGKFDLHIDEVYTSFPEADKTEDYGYGNNRQAREAVAGRPPLQVDADNLRRAATELIRKELKLSPARDERSADSGVDSGLGRQGDRQLGRVDVTGVHYSREKRDRLTGVFFGSGTKAEEASRILSAKDSRLKSRLYAYVDEGQGVFPESGVGSYAHTVKFDNLYDIKADPLGIRQKTQDANDRESMILDAGFDGYYAPGVFGNQGVAILMGGAATRGVTPTGTVAPAVNTAEAPKPARRTDLPQGKMTGAEWKKLAPELTELEDGKEYYRSDLRLSPGRISNEEMDRINTAQRFGKGLSVVPEDMFKRDTNPGVEYSGVFQTAAEHIGDLIHRLSYTDNRGGGVGYGIEAALNKANRFLRPGALDDSLPQVRRNYEYFRDEMGYKGTAEDFERDFVAAADRYKKAYQEMPYATLPQFLAKRAAVNLGDLDFGAVRRNLRQLVELLDSENAETAYWQPFELGAKRSPERITIDGTERPTTNSNGKPIAQSEDGLRYSPPRWYFSPLEKAIESAPDRVFTTAPQVKLWLAGNKSKLGLKDDEIFWTGINDWLDMQGKVKVSKADVLTYLAGNGVQVEEVQKGVAGYNEDDPQLPKDGPLEIDEANERDHGALARRYEYVVVDRRSDNPVGFGHNEEEAIADAYSGHPSYWEVPNATKYGQWQLPGGENYRELLLTLPVNEVPERIGVGKGPYEARQSYGVWFIVDRFGEWGTTDYPTKEAAEAAFPEEKFIDTMRLVGDLYESDHWEEFNILAHIRMNDRVDANGARVLFVEEIQSDLAQEKRKGKTHFAAPFTDKTEAWVSLAVKRIMAYAAANGYDKVAFINGEQSADRYSLAKQVELLAWRNAGGGIHRAVNVVMKGQDEQMTISVDADGKVMGNSGGMEIAGKGIDEVLGKEVAAKIMEKDIGTLKGEGLNIGGEGMKTFYDRIVPQVVSDVLKKVGGKMEVVAVNTGISAEDWADANTRMRKQLAADGAVSSQPGFPVTPAMGKPLALFSRARAESIRWIYDNRQLPRVPGEALIKESDARFEKLVSAFLKELVTPDLLRLTVPATPMPSVLHMLGAPNQWVAYHGNIIDKVFGWKHSDDFDGLTVGQVNQLMRAPMVVMQTASGEFEVITDHMKDGKLLMFALIPNQVDTTGLKPGQKLNMTMVKTAFAMPLKDYKFEGRTVSGLLSRIASPMGRKVVYVDHIKFAQMEKDQALRQPGANPPGFLPASPAKERVEQGLRNGKIRKYEDLVNFIDQNHKGDVEDKPVFSPARAQTETPEFKRWFGKNDPLSNRSGLVLARQSAMSERRPDGNASDSKSLSDLFVSKPFSLEGLGGFDVPTQREMLNGVFSLGDDLEIVRSVVELIPVDVVNILKRENLSAESLFSNKPMLKKLLSADSDGSVATAVDVADALVLGVARVAAKRSSVSADPFAGSEEGYAASGAGGFDEFHAESIAKIKTTGNNGQFDPANPDIRRSTRRSATTGQPILGNWDATEVSSFDNIVRNLQDKLIDTKRVVQSIRDAGVVIKDAIDPYLQEILYHGRAAKRTQDFAEQELRPLLQSMQMRGVSMQEIEDYLWARHAPERNAQNAKIGFQGDGSGLTDAEARDILAGQLVTKNGRDIQLNAAKMGDYDSLSQKVRAINDKTLDTLVDYGLETRDTVDQWKRTYKHYVPLMRDMTDDNYSGANNRGLGTGKGFSIRGSASKRAIGSERGVIDIVANIAMQRERAITRGEKNRVSQATYGLAMAAPNPDFWLPIDPALAKNPSSITNLQNQLIQMGLNPIDAQNIAQEPVQSYIDPRTGIASTRINPTLRGRDDVLAVRINGEDKFLLFSSNNRAQEMVRNLKNLDDDQLGGFLQASAKVTRWFAAVNTQYNPVFGLVNGVRDFGSAMLNLSSTPLQGKQKKVAAYGMSALRGIYADLRDHRAGRTPSSQWELEFEEFANEGGQTGYRDMFNTSEQRTEALADELKKMAKGDGSWTRMDKDHPVFAWLSDYNTAIENAFRVAAYKVAKESGMSKQQAAALAKNLTVNFNKKGLAATQTGALYAFFNAAVQGTARIGSTLLEHRGDPSDYRNLRLSSAGKKIVMGGVMLGVMQALMGAMAGWDDDEPKQFQRERNLIIPDFIFGSDKYASIPYPLGFHVLPNLGRIVTEYALSGFKDPGKRLTQLLGTLSEAFNPLGSSGLSLQTIAPTFADPLVALATNKDWSGQSIAKEDFNKNNPTPGWTRTKDTATPWSKALAYGLNYISGGGEYGKGLMSPTPDQIDFLIGQATGGVGREAGKLAQTVGTTVKGEELPMYKIPVAGRFVGETTGVGPESGKYYDNLERIGAHKNPIKLMREDGKNKEVMEYFRDHPEARLVQMADKSQRDISELRTMKRSLEKRDAPQEKINLINEQIKNRMRLFNTQVRQLEKQAS